MTIAEKLVKDLGEKIKAKGEPVTKTLIKLGVNPSIYYRIQNGNGKGKIRKKTLSNLEEAIKKTNRMKSAQEPIKNRDPGINKTEPETKRKSKSVLEAISHVIRLEKWNVELLEEAREDLKRAQEDLAGNKTGRNKKE